MAMKLILVVIVAVIATQLPDVQGQCNACFEDTKIACIDETHFVPCFSGNSLEIDTNYKQQCPENTVCTGLSATPCQSADYELPACPNARPICSDCSQIANNGYVCLDDESFGLCWDNAVMTGVRFNCAANSKCIQKFADDGQPPCVVCTEMGDKYLCRPKDE